MSRTRAPTQRFLWGETRLLMDYLAATYPGQRWLTNVRVGPIDPHVPRDGLTDAQKRLMGSFRRYADAIVPLADRLVVVETTVLKAVEKIGPLMEYVRLAPQTPELAEFASLPVHGELVSPIPDPRAQALCLEVGLTYKVFAVPWLDAFVDQYGQRFRTAPLSEGRQDFIR